MLFRPLHRFRPPFAAAGRPRRLAQPAGSRVVAAILFACVFAAQSGQLALTPVLHDAARAFGLSTAGAGQIRTVAAAVAAAAALAVGTVAARVRLRVLLSTGIGLLVAGAAISLMARSVCMLIVGQALTGAASSVVVAAGVAAAAAWSDDASRAQVVAWTLVGAPAAWVAAMPVIGVLAASNWRLAFAVPVVVALAGGVALSRAPREPSPLRGGPGLRAVLAEPAVRRWAAGEMLAYGAWSGVLVYAGALFVESYRTSSSGVGVALGLGAAAYIPGTFVARRLPVARLRSLLAASGLLLAVCVFAFGAVRIGAVPSAIGFGALCFLAGARTYLGSTVGLDLATGRHAAAMSVRAAAAQVGWILGGGVGGMALSAGGYAVLGSTLAVLFTAGALAHTAVPAGLMRRGRARATCPGRLRPGVAQARGR